MIGSVEVEEESRLWRKAFADALQDFRQRKFEAAAEKFCKVSELRREPGTDSPEETGHESGDGPSRFYLEKIRSLREQPPPYEWIGEGELTEK